jgi:hypothetical protein
VSGTEPLRREALRPRERRVVIGGALVVAAALLVARGVVPYVERWQVREAQLDATRDRAARLAGLQNATQALEQRAGSAERLLAQSSRRVLHARSSGLAASALQGLLQEAVDGAGMIVNRVEVSPDLLDGQLTATLSVVGDVHGLGVLLTRGPKQRPPWRAGCVAGLDECPRTGGDRMTRRTGAVWVERMAVVALLVAVAALAWPAKPVVTAHPVSLPAAPTLIGRTAESFGATNDSIAEVIVGSNLFSASRKAPVVRFVAPGQEPASFAGPSPLMPSATGGMTAPDSVTGSELGKGRG